MKKLFTLFGATLGFLSMAQQTSTFVSATNLDSLVKTVREFSGEDPCMVKGSQVTIRNRVSNSGNDVAADYLQERLEAYGLSVSSDVYSAGGRNIYATQLGVSQPDSIVMFCAHYDAVADYCADDNASGVAIGLEAARILSKYNFEKTIIYAFWDEEEIGLKGAKHHAQEMYNSGAKIAAVLNMDMSAYDNDNDNVFDIDLNNATGSIKIKDDLIDIVTQQGLTITPKVVQPGTDASDHSAFWTYGYPAVLLGESWANNDQNSAYHSAQDRINLFNLPYYHQLAKLGVGYVGQTAVPVQTISVNEVGEVTSVYPNPFESQVAVYLMFDSKIQVYDQLGKVVYQSFMEGGLNMINMAEHPSGVYLIQTTNAVSGVKTETRVIKR